MTNRQTAILGSFDGLASALGFILALAIRHQYAALIVATIAGAVGAAGSMGFGEWLADNGRSWRLALIMAAATGLGCVTPAIPFYVTTGTAALGGCLALSCVLAVAIARVRPEPQPQSYLRTFAVLIVVTGLSLAASLVAPGA